MKRQKQEHKYANLKRRHSLLSSPHFFRKKIQQQKRMHNNSRVRYFERINKQIELNKKKRCKIKRVKNHNSKSPHYSYRKA